MKGFLAAQCRHVDLLGRDAGGQVRRGQLAAAAEQRRHPASADGSVAAAVSSRKTHFKPGFGFQICGGLGRAVDAEVAVHVRADAVRGDEGFCCRC